MIASRIRFWGLTPETPMPGTFRPGHTFRDIEFFAPNRCQGSSLISRAAPPTIALALRHNAPALVRLGSLALRALR